MASNDNRQFKNVCEHLDLPTMYYIVCKMTGLINQNTFHLHRLVGIYSLDHLIELE